MYGVHDGQQAFLLLRRFRNQGRDVIMIGYIAVWKPVGVRFFWLYATQGSAPATAQAAHDQQQDDDENAGHQSYDDGKWFFHAERGAQYALTTTDL